MTLSEQLKQYGFVAKSVISRVEALEADGTLTPEISAEIIAKCERMKPEMEKLENEKLKLIIAMEDDLHQKIQKTGRDIRIDTEQMVHADETQLAEQILTSPST